MSSVSLNKRVQMRERPYLMQIMRQDWRHLLFMHWRCEAESIQKTLPPGLYVDSFDGKGYVSVIPFFMENVRLWHFPPLPGLSQFVEVNIRTYVHDAQGTPGVWFYSLDVNSALATWAARKVIGLPYFVAELEGEKQESFFAIKGYRADRPTIRLDFRYAPSSESLLEAVPESLEFFLVERYALFSLKAGRLYQEKVHHAPYRISGAHVETWSPSLLSSSPFILADREPDLVHYSPGVSVDIFRPEMIRT